MFIHTCGNVYKMIKIQQQQQQKKDVKFYCRGLGSNNPTLWTNWSYNTKVVFFHLGFYNSSLQDNDVHSCRGHQQKQILCSLVFNEKNMLITYFVFLNFPFLRRRSVIVTVRFLGIPALTGVTRSSSVAMSSVDIIARETVLCRGV